MPFGRNGRDPLREPESRTALAPRRRARAAQPRGAAKGGRWWWCGWSWLCLFVAADEFNVVDVERDRGQVEVDGVVGVAAEHPPAGGDLQPAEVLVAAGVVADQGA